MVSAKNTPAIFFAGGCVCFLIMIVMQKYAMTSEEVPVVSLHGGEEIAIQSTYTGKYLQVGEKDGRLYATAETWRLNDAAIFRVMILSPTTVAALQQAATTIDYHSESWNGRKMITVSGCRCSGYSNEHGLGRFCHGWEFEGQTPWCYVDEQCKSATATSPAQTLGSFGKKYEDCSMYNSYTPTSSYNDFPPSNYSYNPYERDDSEDLHDLDDFEDRDDEDDYPRSLDEEDRQWDLPVDNITASNRVWCEDNGYMRRYNYHGGPDDFDEDFYDQASMPKRTRRHRGPVKWTWVTHSGCKCSGFNNSHGFGAYCLAWETSTQLPWCYVVDNCTGYSLEKGSFGKSSDTCYEKRMAIPTPNSTVAKYVGVFLRKMIKELNSGDAKTVAHVRENLVPYLKGTGLEGGLLDLRNKVSVTGRKLYDELGLNAEKLGDAILALLPKEKENEKVLKANSTVHYSDQTENLLDKLFIQYPNIGTTFKVAGATPMEVAAATPKSGAELAASIIHNAEAAASKAAPAPTSRAAHILGTARRLLFANDDTGSKRSPEAAKFEKLKGVKEERKLVALISKKSHAFVAVEPPPHSDALVLQAKTDALAIRGVFAMLNNKLIHSLSTDSLANVCTTEKQVCTGYLERANDVHWKLLRQPMETSKFKIELLNPLVKI